MIRKGYISVALFEWAFGGWLNSNPTPIVIYESNKFSSFKEVIWRSRTSRNYRAPPSKTAGVALTHWGSRWNDIQSRSANTLTKER